MGLPEKDVEKPDPVSVPFVELFGRRDRAGGDRSGSAAEVQEHGFAAQLAQAHPLAFGRLQLEVWCMGAGPPPSPRAVRHRSAKRCFAQKCS